MTPVCYDVTDGSILYVKLFFDTESQNDKVKIITSQKRLMASFKFQSIGQKMLRFQKVTSETSKIGTLLITLAAANFFVIEKELFVMNFDSEFS